MTPAKNRGGGLVDKAVSLRILRVLGHNRYAAVFGGRKIILTSPLPLQQGIRYTGQLQSISHGYRFLPASTSGAGVEIEIDENLTLSHTNNQTPAPLSNAPLSQQLDQFFNLLLNLRALPRREKEFPQSLETALQGEIGKNEKFARSDALKERILAMLSDRSHYSYVINRKGHADPQWVYLPLDDVFLYLLLNRQTESLERIHLRYGEDGRSWLFTLVPSQQEKMKWHMRIHVENEADYAYTMKNLENLIEKLRNLGVDCDDTVYRSTDSETLGVYGQ